MMSEDERVFWQDKGKSDQQFKNFEDSKTIENAAKDKFWQEIKNGGTPELPAVNRPIQQIEPIPQMAHGGNIISDGLVRLHAGEDVIPAEIQPMSMSNLYERMTQKFAAMGQDKGGDSYKVEEYNRLQLEQLITLHNDLRELIASVRPVASSGGNRVARDVQPASYPEPPGSSNFGLWPMGQSVSNAQRQAAYPVG